MEPHLRRQSQFQSGAAQRRLALYRRRQAGAGPVRDIAGQSAQRDADGLLQRAARLRHADRGAARRRRIAPPLLWRREIRVLCRGCTAAESLGCNGGAGDRDRRPRDADGVGLGFHRDLAAGDRLPFPGAALRQYRRADTRHRIETGTVRRQARGARARTQRHAGLLEGAGTDRAGVRRRRILSDRRCRDLRRPGSPELGLFFDGRVAEDFKLNSGTWVSVGTLRVAGITALAPLAQDIVVAGHGGDHVRFLVFPNIAACRAQAGLPEGADVREVIGHEKVREAVASGLARLRAQSGGGSSGHATRALLLAEPASVDGGEITDKGYINQRAVLTRRAGAVATLEDDACAEWIGCGG